MRYEISFFGSFAIIHSQWARTVLLLLLCNSIFNTDFFRLRWITTNTVEWQNHTQSWLINNCIYLIYILLNSNGRRHMETNTTGLNLDYNIDIYIRVYYIDWGEYICKIPVFYLRHRRWWAYGRCSNNIHTVLLLLLLNSVFLVVIQFCQTQTSRKCGHAFAAWINQTNSILSLRLIFTMRTLRWASLWPSWYIVE